MYRAVVVLHPPKVPYAPALLQKPLLGHSCPTPLQFSIQHDSLPSSACGVQKVTIGAQASGSPLTYRAVVVQHHEEVKQFLWQVDDNGSVGFAGRVDSQPGGLVHEEAPWTGLRSNFTVMCVNLRIGFL